MLAALLRYPRRERRAVARRWAHRSNAVQAAARIERGPDFETLRRRALQDRRGQLLRVGTSYRAGRVIQWEIRWSVLGTVKQQDIFVEGVLWKTGGPRRVKRWLGKVA